MQVHLNPKIHVVLLNTWRVVGAKGGAEKVFCEMANALVERGYDVTALFCDPNEGAPGFDIEKGVRVVNSYKKPRFSFLYKKPWRNFLCLGFNKKRRQYLRRSIDSKWKIESIRCALQKIPSPDVFVVTQVESAWILKECLEVEAPVITMFHSYPPCYFDEPVFELYEAAVRNSELIQVLRPEFIPLIKERFPDNEVVCISNVAPQFDVFARLKNKTIIAVGRISKEKRTTLLIKAFALLRERFPDWKCEWYGEAVDKHYLECVREAIKANDLDECFLLMGKTDKIPEKLQEASIFAFPSEIEGFGIALVEAMAMGLPAVGCKDCPAVNTLIRAGLNGLLAEPTPEKYAKALALLMEDEELRVRYGATGRLDMVDFSEEKVWGAWGGAIDYVLGSAKKN